MLCRSFNARLLDPSRRFVAHFTKYSPNPCFSGTTKLRQQKFETAIIERYRRRESSVEEAMIEIYLAGVSVRRVEEITQALWDTRVSPGTVSNLNKKIYERIEQ